MIQVQAVHTTISTSSSPNTQPTTRDRFDRARALVIAQFGAAVLVDLEPECLQRVPSTPRAR